MTDYYLLVKDTKKEEMISFQDNFSEIPEAFVELRIKGYKGAILERINNFNERIENEKLFTIVKKEGLEYINKKDFSLPINNNLIITEVYINIYQKTPNKPEIITMQTPKNSEIIESINSYDDMCKNMEKVLQNRYAEKCFTHFTPQKEKIGLDTVIALEYISPEASYTLSYIPFKTFYISF